jgi:hypothetical protein
LTQLPKGWPYGVEMRNRNWLQPGYFECLARHQVAHVFNSWTEMPPVFEQIQIPGCQTNPDLTAARFLLKLRRACEEAVKAFAPYEQTKEVNQDARRAGAAPIKAGKKNSKGKTLIFGIISLPNAALKTCLDCLKPGKFYFFRFGFFGSDFLADFPTG